MKDSSLDLSYTIGEDWILTAGAGYVYGGKGSITSGSSAIKYETESVSGFGLLGMVWDGMGRSRRFYWCKVLQHKLYRL